jgi:multidrug efflux pump subunit AcrA (membrane-fusion protein)
VIRKILVVFLLAGCAAIGATALSQNPASPGPSLTPATPTPPNSKPALDKAAPAPSAAAKTGDALPLPATSKSQPSAKSEIPARTTSKSEAEAPMAKDAPLSKAFPTSSAYSTTNTIRKELIVERALVTLIDNNLVPATEAGPITEVPAKEGQSVEKNALVAVIDTRSTEAKRRIAEAEHYAAAAQAENEAEIEVARAAIAVSKSELEQSEEIRRVNPRAVSESEMRKQKFTLEKSYAQEKQALNEKKIAGLTANAKQAQLDAASIEMDLRQIRSPFDGMVVEVMKNVGDWVTVGEPIMHIVGLNKLKVKGFVFVSGPNGASHDEVIGKPVTITVESTGGRKHTVTGIIGFASPVIEGVGTSRQFRVWAEVDNQKTIDPITRQESWKIQPGSVATMTINLAPERPAAPAGKADKSRVNTYKPVADDKAGSKKSKSVER